MVYVLAFVLFPSAWKASVVSHPTDMILYAVSLRKVLYKNIEKEILCFLSL